MCNRVLSDARVLLECILCDSFAASGQPTALCDPHASCNPPAMDGAVFSLLDLSSQRFTVAEDVEGSQRSWSRQFGGDEDFFSLYGASET